MQSTEHSRRAAAAQIVGAAYAGGDPLMAVGPVAAALCRVGENTGK